MTTERDTDGAVVSFLMGVGIGAAVSAVAALLYAPKPGAEARRGIADATNELRARVEKLADQMRDSTREITVRVKHDLDAALAAAQEAADARRAELQHKARGE